eukprot:761661-Hanusia_phi.AAC.1
MTRTVSATTEEQKETAILNPGPYHPNTAILPPRRTETAVLAASGGGPGRDAARRPAAARPGPSPGPSAIAAQTNTRSKT